jgi:hypothetical protein
METLWNEGTVEGWRLGTTTVVVAQAGRFWFTRKGDSQDYFLVAGEALTLPRGRWVVQALHRGRLVTTSQGTTPRRIKFGRCDGAANRLSAVSGI